ncbi:hypothetical protein FACS189425_02230 [Clostridia bacterium]|nr:hypothetical protein FACS189425_02230 [Clostridia bacterium]
MAIFHLNLKIVTRGTGASAVAKAAYHSGDTLTNEYDGRTFDYARKSRVVYKEIFLPEHAPREFADRSTLWNAVEKVEKAKNSQLARNLELALPIELTREQNISFLRQYVQSQFPDKGMIADVAMHDSGDGNPHAHILLTMRPFNADGSWGAKFKKVYELDEQGKKIYDPKTRRYKHHAVSVTDWNDPGNAEIWRAAWADATNAALAAHGFLEMIDHRSFERQGKEEKPTVHMGVAAAQMERRGIKTNRGDINRQVADYNKELRQINARIKKYEDWLTVNRDRVPKQLSNIIQAILAGHNGKRWSKLEHLQLAAKTKVFMDNNKISDIDEFADKIAEMKRTSNTLADKGRANERRLKTLTEHLRHSENFKKFAKVAKRSDALFAKVRELEKQGGLFSKGKIEKAREEADAYHYDHSPDIAQYDAAKKYLDAHLNGHKFTDKVVADWKAEQAALLAEKSALLAELYKLKDEIGSAETLKKFAVLAIQDEQEQEQSQEQTQAQQRKKSHDFGR